MGRLRPPILPPGRVDPAGFGGIGPERYRDNHDRLQLGGGSFPAVHVNLGELCDRLFRLRLL